MQDFHEVMSAPGPLCAAWIVLDPGAPNYFVLSLWHVQVFKNQGPPFSCKPHEYWFSRNRVITSSY